MRKAILDTSFILTAIRQKIDIFPELREMGFEIIIPDVVLREVKSLSNSGKKKISENSKLALKIMSKNPFKEIKISGKNVDSAIINYANLHPRAVIATLDSEIKKKTKNQKIVIVGKKTIDLV